MQQLSIFGCLLKIKLSIAEFLVELTICWGTFCKKNHIFNNLKMLKVTLLVSKALFG